MARVIEETGVIAVLELILLAVIAYLLWCIVRIVSAGISSLQAQRTTGAAPAGAVKLTTRTEPTSSDSNEPYIVDDDGWEDGGGHTELCPSKQTFTRKDWWVPGDREQDYDYTVNRDSRIMCRLRHAMETGTKSGDAPFEERFYHDFDIVKDGVVLEEAVRLIREGNRFENATEEIAQLTAQTEWHELTPQSSWPELWYHIVKVHVGEHEARHGIRKELERLKRGVRIIKEQTSQWFTVEHDDKFKVSAFKPVDESSSQESLATILNTAIGLSGITSSEAHDAHFRIRSLSALLGDTKTENQDQLQATRNPTG